MRSTSESLILKVYDKGSLSSDFIGQCLLPLADLSHDGMPMGFDLSLENMKRGAPRSASVALELTYNPLTL